MVISSPCLIDNKELTSPEQMAPGKDFSNPLIVDSLLKTIWSSMHHVFTMKHNYLRLGIDVDLKLELLHKIILIIRYCGTKWGNSRTTSCNYCRNTCFESLYNNLAIEVEKVNSVNHKIKETNAELTTELARYKNQEKCFEINQEKYDKLERCYQNSVYQEQCLTKKINALHLSSAKTITTLSEEIENLNNQLSKENSTVSFLQQEKKKLKSDFKIREDELLDKQIQLENKIKELDNIFVKTGQSIQTMHMLSPKPDSFYDTEQKMALGYKNHFYLKQA
ncbi:hypothetical protein Tco_0693994 [Tanacetum coccineum]